MCELSEFLKDLNISRSVAKALLTCSFLLISSETNKQKTSEQNNMLLSRKQEALIINSLRVSAGICERDAYSRRHYDPSKGMDGSGMNLLGRAKEMRELSGLLEHDMDFPNES